MSLQNVIEVTFEDFDQVVLRSNVPVAVDFWAPWCRPCVALAPIFEQLAGKFAGKAKFAKFNVDENPLASDKYSVRTIPTVGVFKNGELTDQAVGGRAIVELLERLAKDVS